MAEPVVHIWPGSSSFASGSTPYGFYDTDAAFASDADRVAKFCGIRLGHGIMDVELQDVHFYAAFEEAVNKYSTEVNTFNTRDNLLGLAGLPTGSLNLTGQYVQATLGGIIQLAQEYANEVGAGGTLTWYTGSIQMSASRQVYNFKEDAVIEEGDFNIDSFTIRKVFHDMTPALSRVYDPLVYDGGLLNQFGWEAQGQSQFLMMPLHYDLLRLQAIEMNDQIRKSGYSFQITGDRIRIFPIPTEDVKLYFHYTLDADILDSNLAGSGSGLITDYSNIPYENIPYSSINAMGKSWIKEYTLALAKETLGLIRSKYSAIPIPDQEVTLNGSDLVTSAQTEKDALIEQLRVVLDSLSKQAQLERKQAEAGALSDQMNKIPMPIFIF